MKTPSEEISEALKAGGILTISETARVCEMSKMSVYRKLKSGQIDTVLLNGKRYCGFFSVIGCRFGLDCEQVKDAIYDWVVDPKTRQKPKRLSTQNEQTKN